ncbi:MAG: rod shape-determining protein MreD [Pseudomonadota bacterium]
MASAPLTRTLLGPGLYLALAGALVLARLVPLSPGSGGWPGPDLLLCLTLAWVLRRPDLLPIGLVAAVALLSDLLLGRPPGLWAALLVLATEYMRGRSQPGQEPSLTGEVALFAVICTLLVCANWLLMAIFMVPQPPLPALLAQVPVTVLAYPLVVLVLVQLAGIRRAAETGRGFGGGRA